MFSLRHKLGVGFGGLLAILLLVSGLGVVVLWQYRGALDKFFYENWRSVEYGQAMVEGVDRLNDIAQDLSPFATHPLAATIARQKPLAEQAIAQCDQNCYAEDHNITLDGERELAEGLTRVWEGRSLDGTTVSTPSYRAVFERLLDPHEVGAQRAADYAQLRLLAPQVKAEAQGVTDLNLRNMTPVDGKAKQMADTAILVMTLLAVAATALAVVFTVVVARSILRPLRTIMKSIEQIEQGNLDLVVQVKSRDEIGQLAEAFNSMTLKLREYRRSNRAKLIRTQQTTQLAVNSLPDAIAVTGPDGTIELSNAAAQKLFGLDPEARLTVVADRRLLDLYNEVVKSERPSHPRGYESTIEVYDKGGQLKFFLPHAVPILDSDGHMLGVTLVLADVTNLRRLDEMKSGLLSVVSHELKTPLTSIRMAVHLLLEEHVGPLTPKQTELATAARDDSDRLNRIIENLLDMGRLESGRGNFDLKTEHASQLIQDAVGPMEAAFHDRGLTVEIAVPEDDPGVLVDASRIGHVFANLLTNAIKFTDAGGKVRISAEAAGDLVRFSVTDTGIGISPEYLPHVFDRFFRVPNGKSVAGAGLGLAIVRDIVQAHGGDVAVQSTPGLGSCFSFTLQRAPDRQPETAHEKVNHETGVYSHH